MLYGCMCVLRGACGFAPAQAGGRSAQPRRKAESPESVNALFHLPVPFRCKGGLAFSGRDTFTIFAFTSNPLVWFRLT